nr:RNA-directed DNA polymerase, eukaryota [Tanacetum cinerariifolium]
MGSYRTKEDDVYKIFTSVFITNFPESCLAKELFQSCKQYGHVLDTFIPNKRSKTGRRFHRTPLNEKKSITKKTCRVKKDTRVNEVGNTYVHVVKGQMQPENKESKATPALVLSDECLLSKDLSKSLFGRVKQFALLANIRKAIRSKETPGWVPDFMEENNDEEQNDDGGFNVHESGSCGGDSDVEGVLETIFEEKEVNNTFSCKCTKKNSKEDVSNSVCSGHFKTSMVPRTGGSILSLMYKLVKVGQVMGYKMDGCLAQKAKKDWVKELCVINKVNFLALQETKMENIELFSVKMCWGNFAFGYVHSDSVGNSGGILCLWDPNSFRKSNATVSDYFVMIRGVWRQTGIDLLIIAVYAPHDLKDKQMLWDYLTYEIGKWKGEVVIMGDFNEVRYKSDRFGLVFNVQGANVFNSFITNARLKEVPLGGSSFTWCHKSTTKMSKLDIFFISKIFLNTCSNITANTLERNLSDHRPILLRESHFDYVPTQFRFFHHWIEMEGFSKFMGDVWREGPCDESNAVINMMIKLKYLKTKIQEWNKKNMLSAKNVREKYKDELEALEAISDKGDGNVEVVNKRMEGIMDDGMWIESPNRVKGEFFHHFNSRFDKPDARRVHIEMRYSKTLTCDQQVELESDVSNEEIKRAVWDCGIDKSPGPDVFTFVSIIDSGILLKMMCTTLL